MKENFYRKNQSSNPISYILLAGILLGIVISWNIFKSQAEPTRLAPTDPPYRPTTSVIPTTEGFQVLEITPKLGIHSTAQVGKPAPDFSLKTIEGKIIKLSDLNGKAVLLNLWASWCPPCRYEMPGIQRMYEKYKDKGLVVLGINITAQDNLQDVKAFVQEFRLSFPILLDETGDVSAGLYGMRGLPMSFFINPEGNLQRIQVGAMLPEKLEGYLTEVLPQ